MRFKIIPFLLALAAFVGSSFAQNAQNAFQTISWEKAIEISKSKAGGIFVDVRTPQEVSQGTVNGSVNVPLQQLDVRVAELPKDKNLLVFCRSGVRSKKASEFLASQGYTKIYNIDGGFTAAPPAAAFK